MKLYAGTTEQVRADAQMHRIAEKLLAEYTTQIGHWPAPSEVVSWQNSLMALSMLVDQAELNDHGVILEYQLGNTSRRLDAMLTGHSPTSAENAERRHHRSVDWQQEPRSNFPVRETIVTSRSAAQWRIRRLS